MTILEFLESLLDSDTMQLSSEAGDAIQQYIDSLPPVKTLTIEVIGIGVDDWRLIVQTENAPVGAKWKGIDYHGMCEEDVMNRTQDAEQIALALGIEYVLTIRKTIKAEGQL
ncbi:MAG: hypothetical protein COA73_18455 [Candidatus Hydrogenedentota bacterium]|nr:MAG: hypothetical protein COA73_18455 [Candidatus Hydrogenedentota bacterium]